MSSASSSSSPLVPVMMLVEEQSEDEEEEEGRMEVGNGDEDDEEEEDDPNIYDFFDEFVLLSGEELIAKSREYYKQNLDNCRTKANRSCPNNPRCLKGLGQKAWLRKTAETDDLSEGEVNILRRAKFCGLRNLGATCYLNTFIQLWFHNVHIRQAFYRWRPAESDDPEETSNSPIRCLQSIFAMMQFSRRPTVDPEQLVKCLKLNQTQEQDQHEFCTLFIGKIESLLRGRAGASHQHSILKTIHQQYRLETATVNKCSHCNTASEVPSECMELLLHVKGFKTLEECLGDFFKEEVLEGSNQYRCRRCERLQDARRYTELRKLPRLLNLQLLRFHFSEDGRSKKINTFVSFPSRLDMNEHMPARYRKAEYAGYSLFAVLVHEGQSAHSGHYITFIKREGVWYKFNDEQVQQLRDFNLKVDAEELVDFKDFGGGGASTSAAADAAENAAAATATTTISKVDSNGGGSSNANNNKNGQKGSGGGRGRKRKTPVEDGKREVHRSKTAYMLVYRRNETAAASAPSEDDDGEEVSSDVELPDDFEACDVPECLRRAIEESNAEYEKEQQELADQRAIQQQCKLDHRETVRKIWQAMAVPLYEDYGEGLTAVSAERRRLMPTSEYEVISRAWLQRLFEATIREEVPPVDNRPLLCVHGKLAMVTAAFRNITSWTADYIYDHYGTVGPRLEPLQAFFCEYCVSAAAELDELKRTMDADGKTIKALMQRPRSAAARAALAAAEAAAGSAEDGQGKRKYLVGKESFKRWKALRLADVKRKHARATARYLELRGGGVNADFWGNCQGTAAAVESGPTVVAEDEEEEEPLTGGGGGGPDEEQEGATGGGVGGEAAPQSPGGKEASSKADSDGEEQAENVLRFNEDAHCPHGLPLENVFDNKIVDEEVWQIFAKHFPFSKAVDPDDPTCDHCYDEAEEQQNNRDFICAQAEKQENRLGHLLELGIGGGGGDSTSDAANQSSSAASTSARPPNRHLGWSDLEEGPIYYVLSAAFFAHWKRFVDDPVKVPMPGPIPNDELLCARHQMFLFPPGKIEEEEGGDDGGEKSTTGTIVVNGDGKKGKKATDATAISKEDDDPYMGLNKKYIIINDTDWVGFTKFYEVSNGATIAVMRVEETSGQKGFLLVPEFCRECHMAYLRAERAKQFVYHNVSIYVQRPLSEEEEWAANNPDSEAAGTASTTSNGDTYKGFNKKARLEDEEGGGEYIGGRGGGRRRTASNSSTGDHHHARNGHDSDASAAAALSADVVLSSFNLRRSSRRRRGRNELELKVSSSDKLRDVKTRIMNHFKVPTYDQVLHVQGRKLETLYNSHTLGDLEIEPNSVFILTVDDRPLENEDEDDIEYVESAAGISNGGGFKGTSLL